MNNKMLITAYYIYNVHLLVQYYICVHFVYEIIVVEEKRSKWTLLLWKTI